MQTYFTQISTYLASLLHKNEQFTCWFSAESSDFVRFNRSAIRQPGHVIQRVLKLQLIDGKRHTSCSLTLAGELENDRSLLLETVAALREQLPDLPDDPYLLIATEVHNTSQSAPSALIDSSQIVEQILQAATGYDMVGFLTSGSLYRGFANSFGQNNWYQNSSVNFDWSLFHAGDKAVKSNYASFEWNADAFRAKFDDAVLKLTLLKAPPITVPTGSYRVYLTPTALNELIGMLNWGGFSEKSLRTRQSALRRLLSDEVQLHPSVNISEDSSAGLAPGFQSKGFIKPDSVALIAQGKLVGSMISPRSATEYGLTSNAADDDEKAESMRMQPGSLAMKDVLTELGTGIYISNVWYVNFSDKANCRMTGMTRFATFWVEDGEIKAPLNVMRFDDSLYRMLGENLLALTEESEILMNEYHVGERSSGGAVLPGALLKELRFVL